MNRLRVSLIGLGLAVEPHAKSLVDLGDRVEVRWAVSRSRERAERFAARYPFPVTTDVDKALCDPDIDAVILATPPATHLELGRRSLDAGKHLLIEKPLDLTAAGGEELVEIADLKQRQLGVVLQHRFRTSSLRVSAILASGALGSIEAATVSVPWWRPQSYYDEPGRGTMARDGGGVLMTQAIHVLDLFRALVGVRSIDAARIVTTSLHRMETEDLVTAMITLGNGAPGTLFATTAAYPGRLERIEIIGSRGSILLEGDGFVFETLDGAQERQESNSGSSAGANPMGFSHDSHRALIADFIASVQQGRTPTVSGKDALATQLLIDQIISRAGR